jgi:hypothetical protein
MENDLGEHLMVVDGTGDAFYSNCGAASGYCQGRTP